MRNTKTNWEINIGDVRIKTTVGLLRIHAFHEECDESEIEVDVRRDLDSSYSCQGMEETSFSRIDDGCLWYLTTTRPLSYTEFFVLKDTGVLPVYVEYEIVLGGGSYFRAGTSSKTLRRALKANAESNLCDMRYSVPCKDGLAIWTEELTAQEIDARRGEAK